METFTVEKLSYNKRTKQFQPKKINRGLFIKGPLPLAWITTANTLPGKAGAVGVAIWFLVGVKGTRTIKLTRQIEEIAACGRKAVYAAITNLEQAGLINVVRHPGARPTVTVVTDAPPTM